MRDSNEVTSRPSLRHLRLALAYTLSTCLVFQPYMIKAWAQQIVPDGRTQTGLSANGSVTDITTKTIANGNAFNSFSKFDVDAGNTVNLRVPDQADRLINIVRDKESAINGILNTYKDGTVGGDVYFLNPKGIVVGEGGVINAGRLTLQTPTSEFAEELLNSQGAISHAKLDATIRGEIPLSESGTVRILGEVNARDALIIQSANQKITGTVREGAEASRVIFEKVVNTEGVTKGANAVSVDADGTISLLGPGQLDDAPAPIKRRKMIVVDTSIATRTETALKIREGLVDITTNTINGNNAYNSFSIFDVFTGQTVNLIVPGHVANLINVVRDKRSDIDGQLNVLKDGQIGGNVYFLNPRGVVVGANGIIRTDSLTIATPTIESIDRLMKGARAPEQNDALTLANLGALQKNKKGVVNVAGVVEAKSGISLDAGQVELSGRLSVEGTGAAGIVPQIVVHSVADTIVNGAEILAEGATDRGGGRIELRAGNDVTVKAGSLISVRGKGVNSDAGEAIIFAENTATLAADASVLALGGTVSGNGGFIEFSGARTVNMAGGTLEAGAFFGQGGEVLIDPADIVISANTCLGCESAYSGALTGGAAFSLLATHSITLGDNVFLSTRQVGGATDRASHETAGSTGDSGNITLTAPIIDLKGGSAIFAKATAGFAGGDVTLLGKAISLDNAMMTGTNIALKARDEKLDTVAFVVQVGSAESRVAIGNGSRIEADGTIDVSAVATAVVADLAANVNRPYLLASANKAFASVTIDGSTLTAQEDVKVEARSEAVSLASDLLTDSILPLPIPFDAAVGVSQSRANVAVSGGSLIESTQGGVDVHADSTARVEALGTARNITLSGIKLPYAAALSVGVIVNDATVLVEDSTLNAATDVAVTASALSRNDTSFDVMGGGSTNGALGIGFNYTDHTAVARVRNSDITAGGDVSVLSESLQRSEQAGTLSVKDSATDNVLDLLGHVVTAVVREFFTEDGEPNETGEKITEYWGIATEAAGAVDALASIYSQSWGEKSAISGSREEGKDSVWGAAAGAMVSLNTSVAEITAGPGRTSSIHADGTVDVTSLSNALNLNSVATEVAFEGESGTATALALNLTYEKVTHRATLGGDDATGAVAVKAAGLSVQAGQFEPQPIPNDEDEKTVFDFNGQEMSGERYGNGRSVVANARGVSKETSANTYALGIGVSSRDVAATVDHAALTLAADGALAIGAQNQLSVLYMEAGDNQDMGELAKAAAAGRLGDELAEVQAAKQQAKRDAEVEKATATNAAARSAADAKIQTADADLKKAAAQEAKVEATQEAVENPGQAVATLGSSYTVGFNYLNQNTKATLGSGVSVGSGLNADGVLSGAIGEIEVLAQSGIETGGLSTYATLNGGGGGKNANSGTALNIGVNVLLGETSAKIAQRSGSTGADAANTLQAEGAVTVRADNATAFKIVNESATPEKMAGDATSANLITLSGGLQMLDTVARLERSVEAGGDLKVEASNASALGTYLSGSTAGGEQAPATEGLTNGLDLLTNIAGYKTSEGEEEGEEEEGSETSQRASLGIGAILNVGFVASALRNSAGMAESAEKAKSAQEDAQNVMNQQGKKDFVLSAGFTYNSFDTIASTADNLRLAGSGVTVGAYNDTDAEVSVTAKSEFDEGAGATVLAVAANIANQDNRALVGSGSTIVVGENGLTVEASTKVRGEDEDGQQTLDDETSEFRAESIGESGLKGSQTIVTLGLNIVDFENEARVGDNVTIVSRDAYETNDQAALDSFIASSVDKPKVTVSSAGSVGLTAEGNAAAGTNGLFFGSEDGLLEYHEKTEKLRGGALGLSVAQMATPVVGGYLDARVRQRQSEVTEAASGGGEGKSKGFGIGINVGTIDVLAKIGNGNTIVGMGDLSVLADAKVRSSAKGVAGTGPSDEILSLSPASSESAGSALDAAAGINVVYGDVSASLGNSQGRVIREASAGVEELSGGAYVTASSLSVEASTQAIAEAYSDGKAAGAEAADGASGAINLHNFDTTAQLSASVRSSGDVSVKATADTVEIVKAEASARGTPVENYAAKLKTSVNNLLVGSNGDGAGGSMLGRAKDRFMSNYNEASQSSEEFSKTKSTQSFAAALGFNFADHDTRAIVSDGVRIEAEGAIAVVADHDAMSMTEVSGAAVLSDKATGAAISGNVILSTVETRIGNDVVLGSPTAKAESVTVQAMSRFNTGVNVADLLRYKTDDDGNEILDAGGNRILDENFPEFVYSSEAIAGAGGKGSSLAGALATTIYVGDTTVTLGDRVAVDASGDVEIGAYDQSKLANKAWGVSASAGMGSSAQKSARGAVGSVIYRGRKVSTTIGDDFRLSADGDATIVAKVLTPSEAWVGPESDTPTHSTTWMDYVDPLLGGDIAAPLRNADPAVTQSMHNQAIAAAAAGQSTQASFSGALGLTVANGVTKVAIGQRADVSANVIDISSTMNQEVLGIGGVLAVSLSGSGGVFGAQAAVTVVLDKVLTDLGANGSFVATGGNASVTSKAATEAMSITAVASLSGGGASNTVAANLSFNTLKGSAATRIGDGVSISSDGDLRLSSENSIDAFAFAGALGVSFGSNNPIAATIVGNIQLSSAQTTIGAGASATSDNGSVAVAAKTDERLLSVPVAGGGLTGVVSVTVVNSTTRAFADATSTLAAERGNVSLTAENSSDVLEVAGAIAVSMNGTALGLTMPGTGISKTVEAQIGNATARNIEIGARSANDVRQLAGAGAVSTSSSGIGGTLGVLVVNNEVRARIAENTDVTANGNVWLDASDESSLLQFGGAVGASTSTGVGASAATMVVRGSTNAEVGSGATVTARGLESDVVTVSTMAAAGEAAESERTGIVQSFNQLKDTGLAFADDVKAAFSALGSVGSSKGVRDSLLSGSSSTRDVQGFVMTADGAHRAVAIQLALGASTGSAAVGGVVDVGVFSNSVGAYVRSGATINNAMSAGNLSDYGAAQDVLISAQSTSRLVGFGGMAGAGSSAGVGGGATVNVFNGATTAWVDRSAVVKARRDVDVSARRALNIGVGNFALGGGGTAGVGAAVNVAVVSGSTTARLDGRADAWQNVSLSASEASRNTNVIGALGVGGTAGVGGAINVLVAKSTTMARLGSSGAINALGQAAVEAQAKQTIGNIVVAGGGGGTVGIGASINVIDARRGVAAYANGAINQDPAFASAGSRQTVNVEADSSMDMFRLVGGIGGGGVVGAGVSFDMATVLNQTDAAIGPGARVRAGGGVTVDAASSKNFASSTLAGGVGGVVGVGGAFVINRTGSGNLNDYKDSEGNSTIDGASFAGQVDGVLGRVAGSRIADGADPTLNTVVADANDSTTDAFSGGATSVSAMLTQEGSDRTSATIGDGATVVAGGDVTMIANDWSRVYQLAGSVGGGGVVGVGLTVGVNDFASSAVTAVGNGATATAGGTLSMSAQNISVLEAVNFAGAASGGVSVAGSVNYNRQRNTALGSVGSLANLSGYQAMIASRNEQNMAATTIGLAGGFVGAGVSVTYGELGGGATTMVGNGASIRTSGGRLDVDATQLSRMSVNGLAGAGGAVAGQAAVSVIKEDSDAKVALGTNVTLGATGILSIAAENKGWAISDVVGIAFGAVAAGYVQSYADSFGDATVEIGDNHRLTGSSVAIGATVGELQDVGRLSGAATLATVAGDRGPVRTALEYLGLARSTYRRAETFALAAAGGLGATQGSNIASTTDNDATIALGLGQITSTSGSVTVDAENVASLQSKIIGLTVGAVSLGVHVARSNNNNDSRVTVGSSIDSADDISVLASTDTKATAESFAISAGTVSIGISLANITDTGTAAVTLSDFGAKKTGADLIARDDITIASDNKRRFDAKMNAFGVGLLGGGSGNTNYNIAGTSAVTIGDNRKIAAKQADGESNGESVVIHATNTIAKDVFGDTNLNLKAYGAVAISALNSDIAVKTDTGVRIGRNAEVYSADTLSVKSMANVLGDDRVNVDAGGVGAFATGKTHFAHVGMDGGRARSTIGVGDMAKLFAGEHLEIAAVTDTHMATSGDGSAFGAAASLRVDAVTTSLSDNLVTIGSGADVASFGEVFVAAGEDYVAPDDMSASNGDRTFGYRINTNDVSSQVISLIGAAIGIPRDNISRAVTDQTNRMNIASGATIRSGGQLHAAASDDRRGGAIAYMDARNYSATSFLSAFMDIKGVGIAEKTGVVTLDGKLETGLDRARSISIAGSSLGSVTGTGYNWRKAVSKRGDTFVVNYEAPLGDVVLRTGSANGSLAGSGLIETPRDADLRVVNSSTSALSITGLSIPYLTGGKLYVNGTQIKQNGSSLLGSVGYTLPTVDSALTVLGTNASGPNLTVDGMISNLGGSVTIANLYGSVDVRARVQAADLAILAGKDFRLDTDRDINLGNDPISEYAGVAAGYTNYETSDNANETGGAGNPAGSVGSIEALGNIYIKADGVNINGLVRSGVSGRDTSVTQSMVDNALANAQKNRYLATRSEDDRYFQLNDPLGFDPLTATRAQLASISIADLAEIPLFYDYAADRVVAKDLKAEGGTVKIEGRIASTGRGRIEALDGYARFDIQNQSTAALELRDIDTGDGVEGSIIFNDHNFTAGGGTYVQTRWARVGDEIRQYQDASNALTDGRAMTLRATGASAASYNPLQKQRYSWEVDSTYYDQRGFYSHHEDKSDGEGDVNRIFDMKGGSEWSDVDYYAVRGILEGGDWERYGDFHDSWSAPVFTNTPVGSLVVDNSDSSEFRYVRNIDETGRSIESFQSHTVCETRVLGICADWEVRPSMDYRVYYDSHQIYSVKADRAIGIGFFGEAEGRIAATSINDIVVTGAVRNVTGETILASRDGGVYTSGSGLLIANDLTLRAATSVGSSTEEAFRVEQVGGSALVNAMGRNVHLEETANSLRLGQIDVDSTKSANGGTLSLTARKDIDLRASNMGSIITAGQIRLESRTGTIRTNLAGDAIDVNTDAGGGGTLSILSEDADGVAIRETSGDLRLGAIEMPGNVALSVSGNLLNGQSEVEDFAARDAAFASFLDARGYGDPAQAAAETEKVNAAYAEQMTTLYQEYWKMRGATTRAASSERSSVMRSMASGVSAYDEDFVYHATEDERTRFRTDGYSDADIAAYEAKKTAFYHDANTKLGAAATGSYNANFAYTLTDADRAANASGINVDRGSVLSAVRSELVGGNASSSEAASNVRTGGTLSVTVSGTIGEQSARVELNGSGASTVSAADMRTLRGAKVGEVQISDSGAITLTRRNGVSLNASGRFDLSAGQNAFVESQGDLNVGNIAVGDTLQLKTSGDLLNANSDGSANATGRNLILSSAGERFGEANKRFVTETSNDGYVQLRTGGNVYLAEKSGDLRLGDASGPGLDLLADDGSIVSAFGGRHVEINGDTVKLKASRGIGTADRALNVTTRLNGAVDIQTPGDANVYAPDLPILVRTAVVGGDSRIRASSDIRVLANNTFSANSIDWYAPTNITFGRDSTVISRNGPARLVADGDLLMGSRSTLDATNNAIEIVTGGKAVLGRLSTGNASNGALSITVGTTIRSNGDGLLNLDLASDSALATLTAHGGIGGDTVLNTNVARLAFENTNGGNVMISNARSLRLEGANVGSGSSVSVDTLGSLVLDSVSTVDGDITLSAADDLGQNAGGVVDAGTGSTAIYAGRDVLLQTARTGAFGTIDINAGRAFDLAGRLSTSNGNIWVAATNQLSLLGAATVTSGGGDVTLAARSGGLTQRAGSVISSGTGSIGLDAGQNAFLETLRTGGSGHITVNAGGRMDLVGPVTTAEGDIVGIAQDDLALAGSATVASSGGGDVRLVSRAGSLTQRAGSVISS
ncbi:hypothetical protein NS365_16820, partial [Aureimonas ureilytica]